MSSSESFAELLDTNHAPNDLQRHKILTFIAEQESDLVRVQMFGYPNDHQRDIIRDTLRRHRYLLSPIRTVAPEVWSEIFSYCAPSSHFEHIDVGSETHEVISWHDLLEAPLLLTQICSSWRKIAISTMALWTTLGVEMDLRDDQLGSRIKLLQTWIERSGQQPLSVVVIGQHIRPAPYELFEQLTSCSERWKTVVLNLPSLEFFYMFMYLPIWMPSLESLAICLPGRWDPMFKISESATRLKHVKFTAAKLHPIRHNFAWAQLTQFESGALLSSDKFLFILCCSPALTRLSLTSLHDPDIDQPFDAIYPVVHEKLSTLQLNLSKKLGRLLEALTLPKLRTLEINTEFHYGIMWPHLQFLAMLSRSSLEQLRLVDIPLGEEKLMEIACNAHKLKSFKVTCLGTERVSSRVEHVLAQRGNLSK